MKTAILFILAVLTFLILPVHSILYSQIYQNWVIRNNGSGNAYDEGTSIALDNSGNIFVTGHTSISNFDFGSFKYDYCGNTIWSRFYNYGYEDYAWDVKIDNTGNTIVVGESWSPTFPYPAYFITLKYNNSGTLLWQRLKSLSPTTWAYARKCVIDNNNNVIVLGIIEPWFSNPQDANFLLVKYDENGNELWFDIYNYVQKNDYAEAVTTDANGNIYVCGGSESSGTSFDYAVLKYSPTGQRLWEARYNGAANEADGATAIAVDGLGNVYVTGVSREFDPTWQWTADNASYPYYPYGSIENQNEEGKGDNPEGQNTFTTIKYNSSGQQQWVRKYFGNGNPRGARGSAIVLDGNDQIYVTGFSISYPGSIRNYDYTTIKYNANGTQQWVSKYDGPGIGLFHDEDYAMDIKKDNSGNIYITGRSMNNNPTTNRFDYATIKYNSSGIQQWVTRYNNTSVDGHDEAAALTVLSNNIVYVTGRSAQAISNDPFLRNYDYATIRYSNHWLACDQQDNTGLGLNSIEAINQDSAFTVGDNGRIRFTENKGINWFELNSGVNEHLKGIKFLNRSKGIIIGDNSTVLVTSDGGLNWNRKILNGQNTLNSISAFNENIAFITASNGAIYKTSDSGNNWITLNTGSNEEIVYIKFLSSNSGVAVTGSGKILKTNNGGNSWSTLTNISNIGVNRAVFYNSSLGAVAGNNGKIYVTSNGGSSWKNCSIGSNVRLNDIYFRNENLMYVCGENGKIYCSTNRGDDWEEQPTLIEDDIKSLTFFSDNNGIAVTDDGKVLLTSISDNGAGSLEFDNITSTIHSQEEKSSIEDIIVYNNYPNPFNPETRISFSLKEKQHVVIKVYDILGREITTLLNDIIDGGNHHVTFKADNNLSSGIYYYTIKTGSKLITKQMLLLK